MPSTLDKMEKLTTQHITQHLSKMRIHKSSSSSTSSSKTTNTTASDDNSSEPDQQQQQQQQQLVKPLSPEDMTLPQTYHVKYLGKREAKGLWGIKHTRKPVDDMVHTARNLKSGSQLPFLELHVSETGVNILAAPENTNNNFDTGPFTIDSISYGVQDLIYSRVFAMIVVREQQQQQNGSLTNGHNPPARGASNPAPFEEFSKTVKQHQQQPEDNNSVTMSVAPRKAPPRPFAIDLRTAEQIEEDLRNEIDSEA